LLQHRASLFREAVFLEATGGLVGEGILEIPIMDQFLEGPLESTGF
jgi:hypothetical protein